MTGFRQTHDWLVGEHLTDAESHWTWALQSLQALGHIEVNWQRRQWEAAPPTIATMANGGGYAFLCGARPAWLLRRIEGLDDDPELSHISQNVVLEQPVPQKGGPALQLLTFESDEDVQTLRTTLGIRVAAHAGDQLAAVLPSLNAILQTGRLTGLPGGVFPTRMGERRPGIPLFHEVVEDLTPPPGAYCTRLYDVSRYFYAHAAGSVFEASRGAVVYAELRRQGKHVLHWTQRDCTLLVPATLRLPELYERAAVLRTGLLPEVGPLLARGLAQGSGLWLKYRNIDRGLADLLAQGLGQTVQIVDDDRMTGGPFTPPPRTTRPAPPPRGARL